MKKIATNKWVWVAIAAISLAIFFGAKKIKTMVYAGEDFQFDDSENSILKGTRLGELEKEENGDYLIKDNKYSILKIGFNAPVSGSIIKREFVL